MTTATADIVEPRHSPFKWSFFTLLKPQVKPKRPTMMSDILNNHIVFLYCLQVRTFPLPLLAPSVCSWSGSPTLKYLGPGTVDCTTIIKVILILKICFKGKIYCCFGWKISLFTAQSHHSWWLLTGVTGLRAVDCPAKHAASPTPGLTLRQSVQLKVAGTSDSAYFKEVMCNTSAAIQFIEHSVWIH
jgi:hypothetical protein